MPTNWHGLHVMRSRRSALVRASYACCFKIILTDNGWTHGRSVGNLFHAHASWGCPVPTGCFLVSSVGVPQLATIGVWSKYCYTLYGDVHASGQLCPLHARTRHAQYDWCDFVLKILSPKLNIIAALVDKNLVPIKMRFFLLYPLRLKSLGLQKGTA